MSFLSILQTSLMPSVLSAPRPLEALAPGAEETAVKDPQPISSGPPPATTDNTGRLSAAAARPKPDNPAPEAAEPILDEETQSALVDAGGGERLDMPRMSASMASALLTLNAKPTTLAHLLEGSEDGPGLVERTYSRLDAPSGGEPGDRIPYSKSA